MTRPYKPRKICREPQARFFKPRGIPLNQLEIVNLTLDELEAIRLCYYENLYQDEAAREMDISRQTVGRILSSAQQKIASFLINGQALKIEGGTVQMSENLRGKNRINRKGLKNRRRGL